MSKTQKPKTYVAIILDKSGSMSSVREQAVRDYNEQVQQMKENAKEQEIKACLVTFNGSVFEHSWLEDVDNLEEATVESYVPNGGTAMRDAIGYTVKKLQDTVVDKDDENTAFLLIIISDGAENSSVHYNVETLRNMISACQETKKWTFTYMGCSESYLKQVSKETSIPLDNMAVWSNASAADATRGYEGKLARSANYFSKRARKEDVSDGFYSDVKGLCANFVDPDQNGNPMVDHSVNVSITNGSSPVGCGTVSSSVNPIPAPATPFDFNSIQNLVAKQEPYSNIPKPAVRRSIAEHKIARSVFEKGSEVKWG